MENTKSLFSKQGASRLRTRVLDGGSERGQRLAGALFHQFNELHKLDFFGDYEIEKLLLEQKQLELDKLKLYEPLPKDLISFSPSGVSKCQRELIYKANKEHKDEIQRFPFQKRWTRNSTAVHEAVQRDLLYSEKLLTNPVFTVHRLPSGLPAWEQNIKTHKVIKHKGVEFVLNGMCDGILRHEVDGKLIGFEFKTKSTTIGAVGTFKLKAPATEHRNQCVAYSLLFDIDEFILMYESVAKDGWLKGAEAKPDIRTFYVKVTEQDRLELLDRLSGVAKEFYEKRVPAGEPEKCLFCPYKTICEESKGKGGEE